MKRLVWLGVFCWMTVLTSHAQLDGLFYLTRDPASVRSFLAHAAKIETLVPAWYNVDPTGLVAGGPNPLVVQTARQYRVKLIPIVANSGFGLEEFHRLLGSPEARRQMINQLIREAELQKYAGFQFDFEDVAWTDRDALTSLVTEAAAAFHSKSLQLQIATVPGSPPGRPGETPYSAWMFTDWRGAYDLKALAGQVDLICLMTYDQHTRYTPPGPVAGWGWTNENLDYALAVVPKAKLSLGIPLYGYHWFAGKPTDGSRPSISAEYISAENALGLAKAYGGHVEWDMADRAAWFYFYRDDVREWIYYTDERTFRERYDLAKQSGLEGFCSWDLGDEDPGIWNVLPEKK